MSKDFFECARTGGKIVNKKTKDGRTIKICYDKEGNSHIKRKFKNKSKKQYHKKQMIASTDSLQKLVAHFNNHNPT